MWIILLASALAQLVSCVVTCPVEAVRIRVMTCDKRPEFLSFVGTAQEMLDENGLPYFWSGLGALLFRELPFAIAKVGYNLFWYFFSIVLPLGVFCTDVTRPNFTTFNSSVDAIGRCC